MSTAILDRPQSDASLFNAEFVTGLTEAGNVFRVEVVQMTPERAERLLDQNTRNRAVKHNREKNYAGQMKQGDWRVDGNPIRIGRDGVLLDGQHRLYAIVESGTTQTVILVTGLEPESMAAIDTGVSRSLADLLKIRIPDLKQELNLGSLSRALYIRSLGEQMSAVFASSSAAVQQNPRITNSRIIDYFVSDRIVIERLYKYADGVRRARPNWTGCTTRVIAVVRHELEQIDFSDADYFFERIKDGAKLDVDDPIMAVIRYGDRVAKNRDQAPSAEVWAALLIKAWNGYRSGRKMHSLSYRSTGPSAEMFPEAV